MKPMEIASYLGMVQTALNQEASDDYLTRQIIQAIREAQIYMYELARSEYIPADKPRKARKKGSDTL